MRFDLCVLCLTLSLAGHGLAPALAQPAPDAPADAAPEGAEEAAVPPKGAEEVAISFKDAPLEVICRFVGEKLGKPVIPHESIKAKKLTIIHGRNEPLEIALQVVANALRQNGIIIQEYPRHIEFLPISDAHKTPRRVVGPQESVADLEDQAQIVDKIFVVQHHDVLRLKDVIVSMLADFGFVMADPNIRTLIVTDTAANLARVEKIIARLDVPMADETIKRVFPIEHADANDIVAIIRTLIAGGLGKEGKAISLGGSGGGKGKEGGKVNAVFIEHSKTPVLLMAEVTRNWIIAVAPAQVMAQIEKYIEQFDQPVQAEEPFDFWPVQWVDIEEVAEQIEQAVAEFPHEDVRQTLRVVPFAQSRKLLVYGSPRGRAFVRSLLEKLDVESSEHTLMKEFPLQYADAERVAEKIETLFTSRAVSSRGWGYTSFRYSGPQRVKVTYDTYRNSVTVVTDPSQMGRIEKLITTEWDRALDMEEAQPKVYHLQFADPVKVKDILETMYTRQSTTRGSYWNRVVEETTPVGRLFGQFNFEALEDSNVLLVTTKTVSNYEVIDRLIAQLDVPQEAGLPLIVELKHADAEDLAEQLNAVFAERGTRARILRSSRQLTEYDDVGDVDAERGSGRRPEGERRPASPNEMEFWWSQGSHPPDERKTSNLIGRPRIVPVVRRNALLVIAPPAYQERIKDLVATLDQPGLQVVIQAIILEVRHEDSTTVGLRFAADPAILSDARLADQAIGGAMSSSFTDAFAGGRGIFESGFDVSLLIQLLDKHFKLKVLNQPRLYTADNQEATFFDGQDVPYQKDSNVTSEGNINRSITYRAVGTRLTVRPHITQDWDVDLLINVEVSRVQPGETLEGNPTFDRRETDTHIVVKDGETVMLSGIVRQEQFSEKRKVPVLGDVPLLGGLFQSTDTKDANLELIVFITPRVVRRGAEADTVMAQERATLERLRQHLGPAPGGGEAEPEGD